MADPTALGEWTNFYVIVGSSAGALIGLQFVVITLIADRAAGGGAQASSAFATPTIVHFGAALVLSAMLCAPWSGIRDAAIVWGVLGFAGVAYEIRVIWRMRTQTAYQPELEDWLFHALLPFAAYGTLVGSAYAAGSHSDAALFSVGAAVLLLLVIGIHNAWDAVIYHIFVSRRPQRQAEQRAESVHQD